MCKHSIDKDRQTVKLQDCEILSKGFRQDQKEDFRDTFH